MSEAKPEIRQEIEKLSYEEAMTRLEAIVKQMETGQVALAESADLYDRGMALAKHCSTLLNEMQEKVVKLTLDSQGEWREEEFLQHE